jgi:hypothetical protein
MHLTPERFSGHVAYTMAKYGMSIFVTGMAEEFRSDGIAVNALWPKSGTGKIFFFYRGACISLIVELFLHLEHCMTQFYLFVFSFFLAIRTSATEMRAKQMSREDIALLLKLKLRIPDVTADAAYAIVTRDSRSYTQHFCIDEDILREEGITDFEPYAAPRPSKYILAESGNLFTHFFFSSLEWAEL